MPWRVLRALSNLVRRRQRDRELDDEIASYVSLLADEQLAEGASPEAAHRAARLELGSADAVKEAVRDVRSGGSVEQLARDVGYGIRVLRRSPAFTAFTLLTFALGVGGVTIIFTLVNAVLLEPLPYPDSDRLVMVMEKDIHDASGRGFSVAAPNFLDWQRQDSLFESMALYEYLGFNLSGEGEPKQVGGLRVTSGLFDALQIPPLLGRPLLPADDSLANGKVVVISYGLWQRRYGSDPGIVGRSIRLNGEPWRVVGVMPRGFAFTSRGQQVFVPIQLNEEDQGRASHSFLSIARLKRGVTVAAADAELRSIGDRLRAEYPEANANETATVYPMRDLWVDDTAETLRALMVAVTLVLVIAAANVAGLMVARGAARRREMATRLALGGTRGRVLRQLVTESVLLSLGGAVLGLLLAVIGVRQLVAIFPQNLRSVPFREIQSAQVDGVVLGLAVTVAVVAGLLAGVPSALSVMPGELSAVLRDGEVHGATSRRGHRLRGFLVGLEITLAVVVLTGAGLLIHSMRRLHQVVPGLDPDNVMLLSMELPQPDFYGPAVRTSYCADLQRTAGALPGVVSVSAVSHVPFSGANAGRSFVREGAPDPGTDLPSASWGVVCPGYFGTMGIPLVAGRDFTAADRTGAPPVVVINQRMERVYFPGQHAVGKRLKLGRFDSPSPWMTVVGVVGDVHHVDLGRDAEPYMYAPYQQAAWPGMSVVVRTAHRPTDLARSVRQALMTVAPDQPVDEAELMQTVLDRSLGPVRFPMLLFAVFGAVALLLAVVGIFGVAAQSVLQRRRELGIRMALGAGAGEIYRLVLVQALRPVGLGLLAGVAGAMATSRLLEGLLFGIRPNDPATVVSGAVLLGVAALLACLLPAHGATQVDPALVLRADG